MWLDWSSGHPSLDDWTAYNHTSQTTDNLTWYSMICLRSCTVEFYCEYLLHRLCCRVLDEWLRLLHVSLPTFQSQCRPWTGWGIQNRIGQYTTQDNQYVYVFEYIIIPYSYSGEWFRKWAWTKFPGSDCCEQPKINSIKPFLLYIEGLKFSKLNVFHEILEI